MLSFSSNNKKYAKNFIFELSTKLRQSTGQLINLAHQVPKIYKKYANFRNSKIIQRCLFYIFLIVKNKFQWKIILFLKLNTKMKYGRKKKHFTMLWCITVEIKVKS